MIYPARRPWLAIAGFPLGGVLRPVVAYTMPNMIGTSPADHPGRDDPGLDVEGRPAHHGDRATERASVVSAGMAALTGTSVLDPPRALALDIRWSCRTELRALALCPRIDPDGRLSDG